MTTAFPDMVTAAGVPLIGGIAGIPMTGRWFFCDYANGSDGNGTSADGAPPNAPLKTIGQAHTLAVAGRNDVVAIIGDGSTTATQRLTAKLTWSKNATHLIGITAPVMEFQRARIAPLTTATVNINPLFEISASGCFFGNFSFFQGIGQASTDEKLIDILAAGQRNCFWNVDFGGMGHANGAARAGSYVMSLAGSENNFVNCSIGLETIQRSAANASVKLAGTSAQRNKFIECTFPMAASATSPLYLDASAASVLNGSSMTFRRCTFRNLLNISGASTPAVTCTVNAAVNGTIFFEECNTMATKWAAATAQVKVIGFATGNGFSNGTFASAADS